MVTVPNTTVSKHAAHAYPTTTGVYMCLDCEGDNACIVITSSTKHITHFTLLLMLFRHKIYTSQGKGINFIQLDPFCIVLRDTSTVFLCTFL